MFTVTCPHCSRDLRVSREIKKAKMKCRYCGAIFVGSTLGDGPVPTEVEATSQVQAGTPPQASPTPTPAAHRRAATRQAGEPIPPGTAPRPNPPARKAQAPAQSPAPARSTHSTHHRDHAHRHHGHRHHPPKRGVPAGVWAALLVLCLAGIGIGIVVVIVKSQGGQPDAAEATGPADPAAQDDAVMTVEELRRAAEEAQRSRGATATSPTIPTTSPEPIAPRQPATPLTPTAPAEPIPPRGPTVKVLRAQKITSLGEDASGIAGTFTNENDFLLREVRIRVTLKNPAGAIMPLQSRAYEWIPAGMHGRFSVSANKLIPADATVADATSHAVRAPDEYVGWTLDRFSRRVTDDGKIRLRGHSRNPHDFTVRDVRVLCDFFTVDGSYAGTATGQLRRGATMIDAGAEVSYEILFEPPLGPEVIDAAVARIVAKKP